MNGFLVIDKPGGPTSRAVLNGIQRRFPRETKIGHTGTLDPPATGVLVVCIGSATRLADYVQAMGKSYTSRFRFGATSTTDDADGVVKETPDAVPPTQDQLETALASFVGVIEQVPPAFSALKVDGVRAHKLARKGRELDLAARPVRIDAIRLVSYEWPFADVEVDCGKGTYIRSIARDVGEKLGCGGLVHTLRRTRVGPFTPEQGVGAEVDPVSLKLLPLSLAVAGMPEVRVSRESSILLRHGRVIPSAGEDGKLAVIDDVGELVVIGRRVRGQLRPEVVFVDAQLG